MQITLPSIQGRLEFLDQRQRELSGELAALDYDLKGLKMRRKQTIDHISELAAQSEECRFWQKQLEEVSDEPKGD